MGIKYISEALEAADSIGKDIMITLERLFGLYIYIWIEGTNFVFERMNGFGGVLVDFGF